MYWMSLGYTVDNFVDSVRIKCHLSPSMQGAWKLSPFRVSVAGILFHNVFATLSHCFFLGKLTLSQLHFNIYYYHYVLKKKTTNN